MWIVEVGGNLYGPFRTANIATKWADKALSSYATWKLIRLRSAEQA